VDISAKNRALEATFIRKDWWLNPNK